MSLISAFKNIFKDEAIDEEEGLPIYEDDVVGKLLSELEKRRNAKRALELQWQLNANFLVGNQNCDINFDVNEVLNTEPAYTGNTFEVYNRIAPLIDTRQALLSNLQYGMVVNPRTDETEDIEKAEISTRLLKYFQSSTQFSGRVNSAISWFELTGTSFMLSWWDTSKGDQIAVEVHETEDGAKTVPAFEGDLEYGLLTAYEVFPANMYKEKIREQSDVILEEIMTIDEAYDRYGYMASGESIETYTMTPIEGTSALGRWSSVMSIGKTTMESSVRVVTQIYRPSRKYPNGKIIIVIGNNLVHYGDNPYGQIPIVAFKCKSVPGQFFGRSVIEDLLPLQRAYNNTRNKIQDTINRYAAGAFVVPEGSVENIDELLESGVTPGSVIVYDGDRGAPKPLDNTTTIPNELLNEIQSISREMEYVAGVSQLAVIGNTPTGVTSGAAIEKLRSIDNTRVALTGDSIRDGILDLAKTWLDLLKRHVKGYRVLRIVGGNDAGKAMSWCAEDINSYDVEFDTDNELKNSVAQQKQDFLEAYNLGLFVGEDGKVPQEIRQKALAAFGTGKFSEVVTINQLQEKNAQNENASFNYGVIPEISKYDDHAIHIREHHKYALQARYKKLEKTKPDMAKAFDDHIMQHKNIIDQMRAKAQQMIEGANNGKQT